MSKNKYKEKQKKKVSSELLQAIKNFASAKDKWVYDGDLVRLNVDQISGRKEWPHLQQIYKDFVEGNRETVFIAKSYRPGADGFSALIELEGHPWLFWYGDLVKVGVDG